MGATFTVEGKTISELFENAREKLGAIPPMLNIDSVTIVARIKTKNKKTKQIMLGNIGIEHSINSLYGKKIKDWGLIIHVS